MRYLAVDFGDRRVGLAICDPAETIVSPLRGIERRDDEQVVRLVNQAVSEERAEAVVVGLPINMDQTEGPQARRVRQFVDLLTKSLAAPVHLQNEQLSSFAADERLAGRELTRDGRRRRQDAIAAAVILEDFLREKGRGRTR